MIYQNFGFKLFSYAIRNILNFGKSDETDRETCQPYYKYYINIMCVCVCVRVGRYRYLPDAYCDYCI